MAIIITVFSEKRAWQLDNKRTQNFKKSETWNQETNGNSTNWWFDNFYNFENLATWLL